MVESRRPAAAPGPANLGECPGHTITRRIMPGRTRFRSQDAAANSGSARGPWQYGFRKGTRSMATNRKSGPHRKRRRRDSQA